MNLTEQQIERYSRQMILKEVGAAGQEKLLASRVLIVGTGGLGSPAAVYLAAAGVGKLGIIDADRVEVANLQRQIIHFSNDVGKEKVASAQRKIKAINPEVKVRTYLAKVTASNIAEIIKDYDFVLDATDNFPSKFLINDACYFEKVPFSHASVLGFDGQIITVLPGGTACYRCVLASPPPLGAVPSCAQAGVLGTLPGVIGCLQATEALKFLMGIGKLLTDRLLIYDALQMQFRQVRVNRNPQCPVCGPEPSITELKDEQRQAS